MYFGELWKLAAFWVIAMVLALSLVASCASHPDGSYTYCKTHQHERICQEPGRR